MMRGRKLDPAIFGIASNSPRAFCRERLTKCKSLYRKDLLGHFGCVNAVEFSNDGRWLVSGGDDRRVLLWDVDRAARKRYISPCQMKTEHLSNIFCTIFDNETKHIFSAGNDEDVVRHNIERTEAVGHYTHEEAVYCVALPYDGSHFFASAGECGAVFLWDVRAPEEEQLCLAMSAGSFHGVSFNPLETQLVVTANHYDGVVLYDLRYPEVPLIKYGMSAERESAMFAKFNQLGTQILALMRRSGPVLYDVENKAAPSQFNHPEYKNICTLKSPSFIGDADEYVAAGSDDFNIYLWRNPGKDLPGQSNEDPLMVLKGHRSIVNQIRYNPISHTIASSGVEKVIKLWSQFKMEGCHGYITEEENITKREIYSHEQYMQLILDSGLPLSHDYGLRSVDEDPRMLAFFDSLIQRVNAGWLSDESSDEEAPVDAMGEFLLHLASQIGDDGDELTQNAPNVLDSFRLFRSNRRQLTEESERSEELASRTALSRRVRRLLANDSWISRTALHSESHAGGDPGIQSGLFTQEAIATSSDQTPGVSLLSSQQGGSSRLDDLNVEANSNLQSLLDGPCVSGRRMEDDHERRGCDGSSSNVNVLEGEQTFNTCKSICSNNTDGNQDRDNKPMYEVASSHSKWKEEAFDCCLQADKTESRRNYYSNETCQVIGCCNKNSLENQPSTHLCEKTEYVANCNDVNQEIIDRKNASNCSAFPTADPKDYGKFVETSVNSENCNGFGYHARDRTYEDDPHYAKEYKRRKFDEALPYSNGDDSDEGLGSACHVNKTMQDPTCSSIIDTCASVCVSDSNHCSSTISTTSFRDNEALDDRNSETRIRRRPAYKKRNYRRSSNS